MPVAAAVGSVAAIGAVVWVGWFFALRGEAEPSGLNSVGVIASQSDGRTLRPLRHSETDGLRVDLVVSVHPTLWRCGNADVALVVSGTPGFWAHHHSLRSVRLALGWDPSTDVGPPPDGHSGDQVLVSHVEDPSAPLHPAYFPNGLLARSGNRFKVHPFYVGDPGQQKLRAVWSNVYDWDASRVPVEYRFTANWLHPRAFGSCYVSIPSLAANGAILGQNNALRAALGTQTPDFLQAQPPSYGRAALATNGDQTLSNEIPQPSDVEAPIMPLPGCRSRCLSSTKAETASGADLGPVWSCQPSPSPPVGFGSKPVVPTGRDFDGDNCGALAIVDAPGAGDWRGLATLVAGGLLGLVLTGWYIAFVRPCWRYALRRLGR